MDKEERCLAEDEVAASFLVGETQEGFFTRLPGVCNWVQWLPDEELPQLARECSWAATVPALTHLLTAWRHIAMQYRWANVEPGTGLTGVPDVKVDHEAQALYVYLQAPGQVARTEAVTPWLNVDYAADGQPVGVELLALDLRGV